jgi:hypothetical protein
MRAVLHGYDDDTVTLLNFIDVHFGRKGLTFVQELKGYDPDGDEEQQKDNVPHKVG